MSEFHYFVAHDFTRQDKDAFRDAIENAFRDTGLSAYYADLEIRQSHILGKTRDMIFKTQFGIYDITNHRPNVFLELGLAIAAEQPYYIICHKGTTIPADLAGLDRIEYENYEQLTKALREMVVEGEIERLKMKQMIESYSEEDVLRNSVKVYQAEGKGMRHALGKAEEDSEANSQKAWYGDDSVPCPIHLLYGPYEGLPAPDAYSAFFRIKADRNSDIRKVLHIDVISNNNPSLNSSKAIRGIHFKEPNEYQLFKVDFEYYDETDVEYRVIKLLQERRIWVDYVAIVRQNRS